MSDTENVERIANRRSAPVARTAAKTARKKRTTRSSTFKLRGRREKHAPIGKYEELENEVEEKLSEEEDLVDDVEDENKEGKEDADFDEGEDKVEDVSCVSDNEASASASPVRSLRNKKISKPISFGPAKKRTPSSKFSSLMKRSRKQAKTYGMQFSRKDCCAAVNGGVSPQAPSAKLSSEDGDDQVECFPRGSCMSCFLLYLTVYLFTPSLYLVLLFLSRTCCGLTFIDSVLCVIFLYDLYDSECFCCCLLMGAAVLSSSWAKRAD